MNEPRFTPGTVLAIAVIVGFLSGALAAVLCWWRG
jgi:hypothetical protein